jgi:hypothetical protein
MIRAYDFACAAIKAGSNLAVNKGLQLGRKGHGAKVSGSHGRLKLSG